MNIGKATHFLPTDGAQPGANCYRRAYVRSPIGVEQSCTTPPYEVSGGLCYKQCNLGFGSGPLCYAACPLQMQDCGGILCLGQGQTCTDFFKNIAMDGISGTYGMVSADYLSLVQSVLSMATNIVMPVCKHMYEDVNATNDFDRYIRAYAEQDIPSELEFFDKHFDGYAANDFDRYFHEDYNFLQ